MSDEGAVEREVDGFIDRYTTEIAAQFRQARQALRRRVGSGFELVYDNYNALAIGYGPASNAGAVVLSIAAYPKWVTLFFMQGAGLPDPQRLLQGGGSKVRQVRLAPIGRLEETGVKALIGAALQGWPADAAPLVTIVKSISAKRRPRRPAGA